MGAVEAKKYMKMCVDSGLWVPRDSDTFKDDDEEEGEAEGEQGGAEGGVEAHHQKKEKDAKNMDAIDD
jgi:hypothetical protein